MFNDNFTRYSSREDMIIEKWINGTEWLVNEVEGYEPDNTGFHDYRVQLKDGSTFTVEVKEEEYYWYNRTGNIGLDFISAFHFRSREREVYWKNHKYFWVPTYEIGSFLENDIDVLKWGKLITCDADVQLFYVEDKGRTILMIPYSNYKLQNEGFIDYIKSKYRLRINKKSDYGLNDDWESAAFFVKPEDQFLMKCRIDSLDDLIDCIKGE